MTTVFGTVRRKGLTLDAFADITGPGVAIITPIRANRIDFDGDLTAEQVEAIWLRMESTDDTDQARRADLRAKRDAVVGGPTLENVAALAVAEANYMLGD